MVGSLRTPLQQDRAWSLASILILTAPAFKVATVQAHDSCSLLHTVEKGCMAEVQRHAVGPTTFYILSPVACVQLYPVISWPILLLGLFTGPFLSLLLLLMLSYRPSYYLGHRTPILCTVKLLRTLTATVGLTTHGNLLPALPAAETEVPWHVLAILPCSKAFLLLTNALGFQLPFRHNLSIQVITLLCSLFTTRKRCAYECLIPSMQEFYQHLTASLKRTLSSALPIVVPSKCDKYFQPSPEDQCVWVQAWVQFVLGFVVPAAIVDWSQSLPWGVVEGDEYTLPLPSGKVAQSGVFLVFWYLGIVLVVAAAGWQGIEVALRWGNL